MLAVTSAFILTDSGYLSAKTIIQLAASLAATKSDATSDVGAAPAQCRRLVGVWTTLGFELVIRPDGTAYDPGYGATGTMTCVGQTVTVRWRRGQGEVERFTASADDDRLTQSGAFLGVQYARASKDIPPDRYGPPAPPASEPLKPLDLSGL
jgi:hypothetical protein